jgi:arsenate reductase-like glutaredoxin family protein
MAGFQLYGHSSHPACQSVQDFFSAHGVPVKPHEVDLDTPCVDIIKSAILQAGTANIIDEELARKSGLNPSALTSAEIADWLVENPAALRMPIVVRGDQVIPGTDSSLLESMLY